MLCFDGSELRRRREAVGLRREAFAVAIDRSHPTVVGYEAGTITPPANVVGAIADVLGCSPGDLYVRLATPA